MALFLSPSRIREFEQCPYRYQLSATRPVREMWSKPRSYFTFSNTLHDVLRDLYRRGGPAETPWEWVLAHYRLRWRGLDPKAAGFVSRDQAKEAYFEGLELLRRYYETHLQEPSRAEMVERTLEYMTVDAKLWGRLDRVDRLDDGGVEIVDYKTGRYMLDEEAVGRDWQMTLYGLLVHEVLRPPHITLSLYYLREDVKVSVPMLRTPEEVRQDFADIALVIGTTEDFAPTPNRFCRFCDYASLCPVGPQQDRPTPELVKRLEQTTEHLSGNRYLEQKLGLLRRHVGMSQPEADGVAASRDAGALQAGTPPAEPERGSIQTSSGGDGAGNVAGSGGAAGSGEGSLLEEGQFLLAAALLPLLPDREEGATRVLAELGRFQDARLAWAAAETHFASVSATTVTNLLARHALDYNRALETYLAKKLTYLGGSRSLQVRERRTTLAGLSELGVVDLALCAELLKDHPPLFFREPNVAGQLVEDLVAFRHQCRAIVAHARTQVSRAELVEVRDKALRLLVRLVDALREETTWSAGTGAANLPA